MQGRKLQNCVSEWEECPKSPEKDPIYLLRELESTMFGKAATY